MKETEGNKKSLAKIILSLVLLFCFLCLTALSFDIKINLTNSMPIGLYKKTNKICLKKGDIVNFSVPRNEIVKQQFNKHPFLDQPKYFLKIIYGTAGEKIQKEKNILKIGNFELPLIKGQKSIIENGIIPSGFVFVGTPNINSFDSRYYGLINVQSITACFKPWITTKNKRTGGSSDEIIRCGKAELRTGNRQYNRC